MKKKNGIYASLVAVDPPESRQRRGEMEKQGKHREGGEEKDENAVEQTIYAVGRFCFIATKLSHVNL